MVTIRETANMAAEPPNSAATRPRGPIVTVEKRRRLPIGYSCASGGDGGRRVSNPNGTETRPADLNQQQLLALREVPSGAIALGGMAVLLLLIAWLLIYLLVYLPRGMVG